VLLTKASLKKKKFTQNILSSWKPRSWNDSRKVLKTVQVFSMQLHLNGDWTINMVRW